MQPISKDRLGTTDSRANGVGPERNARMARVGDLTGKIVKSVTVVTDSSATGASNEIDSQGR